MTDALQGMRDAAALIRASEDRTAEAFRHAVGVAFDDLDLPTVQIWVKGNRIVECVISQDLVDEYREDAVGLSVYVSTVVARAFSDWRSQVNQRIAP